MTTNEVEIQKFYRTVDVISRKISRRWQRGIRFEQNYYEEWVVQMVSAGYHNCSSSDYTLDNWATIHRWLADNLKDRYTWMGHEFFFINEQDATGFKVFCT